MLFRRRKVCLAQNQKMGGEASNPQSTADLKGQKTGL
jgi:hypothetical protein